MPDGWVGSTRRARLPKDWPAIRARILARDLGRCYICKGLGADGVDHIVAGDHHDDGNLAAVHHNVPPFCHRRKTAAEANTARWSKSRTARPPERHPGLK